jgi:hypothetical protein
MASYDRGDAVKALQTRLYNNLPTGFTSADVKWINSKFNTPNGKPWIRESTTLLATAQDPCKWKRDEMFYTLDLFYPTGSFINAMYDAAKELRQLFENQVFDNVKCLNVEIEDIGEESQWYQIQLNINFYYEGL